MKKEMLKRMVALSVALSVIPCGMASAAIEEGSATGANSNAIGAASQATKENATAIGTGAQATASETNAIGRLAKATAIGANAIGQRAEATSTGAIAVGSSTIASGGSAVAIGDTAHATGFGATSVGAGADATGNYANAYGYDAVASGSNSDAYGRKAQATGSYSVAIGAWTEATNSSATAIGSCATASGASSTALGYYAVASGNGAMALGRSANASVANATALGNGAQATHENSVALGAGSVTAEADSVSIGSGDKTRKLQFVTDGEIDEDSTDAVNGSQLYEEALAREEADEALQTQIDTNAADIATNAADIDAEATRAQAAEQVLQDNINNEAAARIAADNQLSNRLDSTNNRLDKVGAGAAALAALHPLDYDSENKLSFAAGVGNYAGSTAAAVGAFYRPNEDVMFSIGGTAGNGENMVNLGASFAIGKGSSGVAKLSKAELVTKVQNMEAKCISVDAENKELRHEINNAKAENQKLQDRIARLEEMVMKLATK